ncbi:MAG TPA: clostripain-related cysteine peptidase, partial [Chthonomonadales bacterium]|nr:clostripain-related cysteine peptidase [Chthonomonadales bacterium]
DFVDWGEQNYPADNIALVIWDHGSGWRNVFRSVRGKPGGNMPSRLRALSQDYVTGNEIETWELPLALAGLPHKLDMLIIDCSLEQMVEVEHEVYPYAKVLVGSEDSPPGQGYPYHLWLADLRAEGANPCDVGTHIVQDFINFYNTNYPGYTDITQSMIDLSRMPNVASYLNSFAGALINDQNSEPSLISSARNSAQGYENSIDLYAGNKDLIDYVSKIRSGSHSNAVQQAASNLETAVTGTNGAVIISGHGAAGDPGSYGMAVWVPTPADYAAVGTYTNLSLVQSGAAPLWAQFLQNQVQ